MGKHLLRATQLCFCFHQGRIMCTQGTKKNGGESAWLIGCSSPPTVSPEPGLICLTTRELDKKRLNPWEGRKIPYTAWGHNFDYQKTTGATFFFLLFVCLFVHVFIV